MLAYTLKQHYKLPTSLSYKKIQKQDNLHFDFLQVNKRTMVEKRVGI